MARRLRPIGHEERLSVVDHLDELRTRLIVCAVALSAAFALTLWQNHRVLDVVNRPLQHATHAAAGHSRGPLSQTARLQQPLRRALERQQRAFARLAGPGSRLSAADRSALREAASATAAAARAIRGSPPSRQPVTLGIGEPFTMTVKLALYAALLLALPLVLYQLYAFVLPAFTAAERRVALPLMGLVPVLFAAGAVFGYFVVLPPAIDFLQTFNSGQFDVLVQAGSYYDFVVITLVALGVLFQIPVGVLALTRLGVVTTRQLRAQRRYAILVITVVAVLLPGTNPITTLIEMVPLIVLYELAILLAAWIDRLDRRAATRPATGPGGDPLDPQES
jgi:sec-independent protein translocase protein TatC